MFRSNRYPLEEISHPFTGNQEMQNKASNTAYISRMEIFISKEGVRCNNLPPLRGGNKGGETRYTASSPSPPGLYPLLQGEEGTFGRRLISK